MHISRRQSLQTIASALALCAALSLVIAGVAMFNNRHNQNHDSSARSAVVMPNQSQDAQTAIQTPSLSAAPETTVHTSPAPQSSQSNVSNTTVTVNGATTQVSSNDGTTSYDKTYTSADGATVSVSVHNHSSSQSSSSASTGGATP